MLTMEFDIAHEEPSKSAVIDGFGILVKEQGPEEITLVDLVNRPMFTDLNPTHFSTSTGVDYFVIKRSVYLGKENFCLLFCHTC